MHIKLIKYMKTFHILFIIMLKRTREILKYYICKIKKYIFYEKNYFSA